MTQLLDYLGYKGGLIDARGGDRMSRPPYPPLKYELRRDEIDRFLAQNYEFNLLGLRICEHLNNSRMSTMTNIDHQAENIMWDYPQNYLIKDTPINVPYTRAARRRLQLQPRVPIRSSHPNPKL